MTTAVVDQLYSAVDEKALMAHVREFARWQKLSGSKDELANVAYLQKQLDDLGYETQLVLHDAYVSLPLGAKVIVNGKALRCITHSFSRATQPEGLTAPLVYLGKELDTANEIKGCIAVLDGLATPAASRWARRAGALGQIHVSPYEHIHEMCISPVWGSPSHQTLELLPSTVVCSIDNADGQYVKGLIAKGKAAATLHAAVDTGWRKTPILVAELPAKGGTDEPFVLLSGHQDTWYYGVMDNGTANAAMLEVARLCAKERERWRRGLRIVFWSGHSHGRYSGSAWYVDENWGEIERRCVAHVNFNSLGGKGNTVLADAPAAAELLNLARDGVKRASGETLTEQRMARAGDQSFWGVGVPAIYNTLSHQPIGKAVNVVAGFMGDGRKRAGAGWGWWWHTPGDTIDKIDPLLLVRDTRVYLDTTLRLLTDPVLPLDHREQVGQLLAIIDELQSQLAARFDLSKLRDRTAQLLEYTQSFYRAAVSATNGGDVDKMETINATLVALSRLLTPLEYTNGDRFVHDPALGQTQFPALDPLRRWRFLEPGSDAEKFTAVAARQERNRLAHGIEEAISLLENALPTLASDARQPR